MTKEEAEQVAHKLLTAPMLRKITVKTPFALYLMFNDMPYRIISQDGEYCTFQEMTASEADIFMQQKNGALQESNKPA